MGLFESPGAGRAPYWYRRAKTSLDVGHVQGLERLRSGLNQPEANGEPNRRPVSADFWRTEDAVRTKPLVDRRSALDMMFNKSVTWNACQFPIQLVAVTVMTHSI